MAQILRFQKKRRHAARGRRFHAPALIALALLAAFGLGRWFAAAPAASELVALVQPRPAAAPRADAPAPAALPRAPAARVVARHFPLCGSGRRVSCVVDGDTVWIEGQSIRIADIDTPEVRQPACAEEARLAARATRRMQELLNAGPFEIRAGGRDEDRYRRKLRTFHRDGRSLGDILVAEGLAHRWQGRKESWCG